MIGRKITVAMSMLRSVARLDDASNTVSAAPGWVLEGRMIGNIDRPTVAMMQAIAERRGEEGRAGVAGAKAERGDQGATMPRAGASAIHGCGAKLASHAVGWEATVFMSGLDGPSATIALVT